MSLKISSSYEKSIKTAGGIHKSQMIEMKRIKLKQAMDITVDESKRKIDITLIHVQSQHGNVEIAMVIHDTTQNMFKSD